MPGGELPSPPVRVSPADLNAMQVISINCNANEMLMSC
jgi:hypothetical protein